ncbi:putative Myb domain protein 46 [Tripterygium wilfordii]|uniref:Putative Myb domain protein 46 n=1 Tax=Tripterygium wilfordii TaxID=458696 RepID=A0A7J7DQZ4_TRIWF|nr:putative Myb domain protein 46 [Tripterygium wilfordii]
MQRYDQNITAAATTTSASPNSAADNDSSWDQPIEGAGNSTSMPTYMDSSSSSSSTMHRLINPSWMIDNGMNMYGSIGHFNPHPPPPCMAQVGSGFNCFYGENNNGFFNGGDQLYVPPLESISIEESTTAKTAESTYESNNNNNNLTGFGSYWQGEDVKVGEWNLEELMRDVSSFPFLDFSSS